MKFFGAGEQEHLEELDEEVEMPEELPEESGQLALDIIENDEAIIVVSPIAWIDLHDIDVSYDKWVLVIQGTRKKPEMYFWEIMLRNSECYWGKFTRNIILPDNLNADTIEATMEHNLLMIRVEKNHYETKNSIKINRTEV